MIFVRASTVLDLTAVAFIAYFVDNACWGNCVYVCWLRCFWKGTNKLFIDVWNFYNL